MELDTNSKRKYDLTLETVDRQKRTDDINEKCQMCNQKYRLGHDYVSTYCGHDFHITCAE